MAKEKDEEMMLSYESDGKMGNQGNEDKVKEKEVSDENTFFNTTQSSE